MFHSKLVGPLLLAGLLVFVVPPACSFALSLPPQYMPHYVKVLAEAKAYDTNWDIPRDVHTYDSAWEPAAFGSTVAGGLAASSRTASSSVWAEAGAGTVRGVATAAANYQSGYIARGISYAWLYWGDTLTITSSSLPGGTPVSLRLTLRFDAQTYTSAPWAYGTNDANAKATFWLGNDALNPGRSETIEYRDFQPPSNTATMTISAFVGAQLWIHGEVFFSALAAASSTLPGTFTTANLADTAQYNVDVLTAGASYNTSSGVTYVTPVPEPGALAALAVGFAGLAPLVIRRRSV